MAREKSLEEIYEKLHSFCQPQCDCCECIVHKKFPLHKCGRGYTFRIDTGTADNVPEKEAVEIYKFLSDFYGWESQKIADKEEINHPTRYAGGKYECIEVMADVFGIEAVKSFCLLNAFKYLWRSEHKNGVEDIRKAIWYLEYYVRIFEKGVEENE